MGIKIGYSLTALAGWTFYKSLIRFSVIKGLSVMGSSFFYMHLVNRSIWLLYVALVCLG